MSNKNPTFLYAINSPTGHSENLHIRQLAVAKFKELCKIYPYVIAIKTDAGYWVETSPSILSKGEILVHEYRAIVCLIRWDHVNKCQIYQPWDDQGLNLVHNIYDFKSLYGFRIKSSKK